MSDDHAPTGDAPTADAGAAHGSAGQVPNAAPGPERTLDLDRIERDLADVEVALARLDAGTYGTDEVTGQPIPDELLADAPTLRRLPSR
jgi:hypothetical protein